MRAGPIDKLDLRIPSRTNLAQKLGYELRRLDSQIRCNSTWGMDYYSRVDDLRRLGLNSILFFGHKRNGSHKLQIIGTGRMILRQITSEIERVFAIDAMQTEIMRIDLAVDVFGYPVEWFRENVRVTRKRYTSEYDRFVSERRQVETLYFGKRPNIFRFYDKTRAQQIKYRSLKSKRKAGELTPSFENQYGYPEDRIVTRVERQYGGGRIPSEIRTLAELKQNSGTFNPFEPLRFFPSTFTEEFANSLTGTAFLECQGVLRLKEKYGFQEAKRILDQKTSRNSARLLRLLAGSSRDEEDRAGPDLYGTFREALIAQLASGAEEARSKLTRAAF